MGGKSQTSPPPISGPYDAEYLQRYPDVGTEAWGGTPYEHFMTHGQAEGRTYFPEEPSMAQSFEHMIGSAQESAAAAAQAQADALAKAQAEAERAAGIRERDQLYGDYLSAAESSTDYINNMLTEQASNAALTGAKFDINDEMKSTMISDYFASVWGEGDQQRLDSLFKQWGNPEGFEGYAITRGDGSKFASDGEAGDDKTKAVSGKKRGTLATGPSEDEDTLSQATLLTAGA